MLRGAMASTKAAGVGLAWDLLSILEERFQTEALSLGMDQTTCKRKGLWEHHVVLKCCQILTRHDVFSNPTGTG